jgi:hypothetical protein
MIFIKINYDIYQLMQEQRTWSFLFISPLLEHSRGFKLLINYFAGSRMKNKEISPLLEHMCKGMISVWFSLLGFEMDLKT